MKMRLRPKQMWLALLLLVSAAVVLPYVFSRLASPLRRLSVHAPAEDGAPGERAAPDPLRIACYNIAHGRGLAVSNWDGGTRAEQISRLDRIAELLRSTDADVVVLNEVDFDASWSHSVNQAQYLAAQAAYPYRVEERNLDFRVLFWTWRFGNAVLSRYPITEARVVDLPGYRRWETVLAGKKRGVVCDIQAGDRTVRVFTAHLSHRSEAVRVRSAAVIVDLAARSDLPVIVAGDFNSTPPGFPESRADGDGNNAMAVIEDSGHFRRLPADPPAEDEMTFRSAEPRRVIDWILIPRDWRFVQYRVESSQLSDHRPVHADVAPAAPSTE